MPPEYVQAALRHATYEILPDDGTCYGHIPECKGVYANAATLEDCGNTFGKLLGIGSCFGFRGDLLYLS